MVFLTTGLGFAAAVGNPRDLVRQSIVNGERAWEISHTYRYVIQDLQKHFGANRQVMSRELDTYDAIPVGGSTYEELVGRDGRPLPAGEAAKEKKKLEDVTRRRQAETPEMRARRLAREKKARAFMFEVPDAFDWKITGTENLATGPAWVLQATPHPGYVPRSRYARMFSRMRGTLWIDQKDLQWVKADAVATDTVTFGFFLARLAPGSHIHLEQIRLPDGLWVPSRLDARASARILLLFTRNFEEDVAYTDYRRM